VPGRFVVKKGSTGRYRFTLQTARGLPIVTSGLYETRAAAMAGIRALQRVAAEALVEDQTTTARRPAAAAAAKVRAPRQAARRPARTRRVVVEEVVEEVVPEELATEEAEPYEEPRRRPVLEWIEDEDDVEVEHDDRPRWTSGARSGVVIRGKKLPPGSRYGLGAGGGV